jgi:hypothetical protein
MTRRPLRTTLFDLPARARSSNDHEVSQVFGGCVARFGLCTGDADNNNCCKQTMNNTGSGSFKLGCIGFSSGTRRICNWV